MSPGVSIDVLLVAAFAPELEPLRATLGPSMQARLGAGAVQARVQACAVGIGIAAAAAGTAGWIAVRKPGAVVLLGSCGAYPASSLGIGDVVCARRVRLADAAVASGDAEFPEAMGVVLDADPALGAALQAAAAVPADVATTLAVTVDDAVAARIASWSSAGVEHLEAYAVAAACAFADVPFAAVLGVANIVGARAREQWRQHHRAAAQGAASAVLRWLDSRHV
jgi:nucleoside phosphorylase